MQALQLRAKTSWTIEILTSAQRQLRMSSPKPVAILGRPWKSQIDIRSLACQSDWKAASRGDRTSHVTVMLRDTLWLVSKCRWTS
jgi:hypothetical protein